MAKTYPLSAGDWTENGFMEICDCDNNRLCTIPLAFLQESDELNWPFVFHCIHACTESEGNLFQSNSTHASKSTEILHLPQARTYFFEKVCLGRVRSCKTSVSWWKPLRPIQMMLVFRSLYVADLLEAAEASLLDREQARLQYRPAQEQVRVVGTIK